jgi:hypothetical protein
LTETSQPARKNQVHPRSKNKINNTGIGTPINHKNIQPAFAASPALSQIIFMPQTRLKPPKRLRGCRTKLAKGER